MYGEVRTQIAWMYVQYDTYRQLILKNELSFFKSPVDISSLACSILTIHPFIKAGNDDAPTILQT